MPIVELEFDSSGALKGAKEYESAADNVVKKTDDVVTSSGKGKSAFSQWGSEARALANTMGTILVTGIGVAAGAVTGFIAKSVSMASDMEETQAMFDQVFKGMEEDAESWAQTLNESYLMSERAAKDYLGSLTAMLKPMGLAQQEAGEMANTLVQLAADMGSAWNVETEKVIQDMRSALAGSNETLQKYGVVLKESTLQQKAMEMGLADTKEEVGAAERAQALYALMLEKTVDQQGDVARNTDTYAAQMRKLKANIEDITTQIGEAFLPIVTELLEMINEWMSDQENLNKVLKGTIDIVQNVYNGFMGLKLAAEYVVAGMASIVKGVATMASKLKPFESFLQSMGILETSIIDVGVAFADDFYNSAMEAVNETEVRITEFNETMDAMKKEIEEGGDAFDVLKQKGQDMAEDVSEAMDKKVTPAIERASNTISGFGDNVDKTAYSMRNYQDATDDARESIEQNNIAQDDAALKAELNRLEQEKLAAGYAEVAAQAYGASAAIEEASRQSSHGGGDTSVTTSASGSTTYPEWFTDEMRAAYDRAYSDYLTNQDYMNRREIGYSPLKRGYYDAGPDLSPGDPAEWAAKMGYDPNDTGDYSSGGGGGVTVNVTQPMTETELANLISSLERAEARA